MLSAVTHVDVSADQRGAAEADVVVDPVDVILEEQRRAVAEEGPPSGSDVSDSIDVIVEEQRSVDSR